MKLFINKANRLTPEKLLELKEAFSEMDKDGNGYITAAELKEVFEDMGEPVADYIIDEMIRQADTNKDGKISFDGITFKLLLFYNFQFD